MGLDRDDPPDPSGGSDEGAGDSQGVKPAIRADIDEGEAWVYKIDYRLNLGRLERLGAQQKTRVRHVAAPI